MKFSIDYRDIQNKSNNKEKIIICDETGNLYEIIPYVKPKDEQDPPK